MISFRKRGEPGTKEFMNLHKKMRTRESKVI